MEPARFIGIDLGTTNSALAWSVRGGAIQIFDVPQLVAAGEVGRPPALPSFLYFPPGSERQAGHLTLPWSEEAPPDADAPVVGVFARDQGALVPSRQVSSAKSWLSNASVDRTARLLPWGHEEGPKLSPVEASARVLAHLRDAWAFEHRGRDVAGLDRQHVVLTVPASFDQEARELTVEAARLAGLGAITLLEEPIAALYAWIAAHRRALADALGEGALVLVCDVGGGTTDFSLIRAAIEDGELAFERTAIGEHLLLGGDNLDLGLAVLVEQKLSAGGPAKLTLTQRQALSRKCSAAKERLLSDDGPDRVPITVLGAGRAVVGGGLTTELTRDEVVRLLSDGFLPITAPDDLPARDRRVGLRELGLPYESEPAITRHLAAFLTRAARAAGEPGMLRPDAVLFNGGFFTPSVARVRLLDALESWFGTRPRELENARPEAAVAVGAAFYARLQHDPGMSRRLIIRAGSARAYYIGVESGDDQPTAVCVMSRGTQEGTRLKLERDFTVMTNQPVAFTLYSSLQRTDPPGAVVRFSEADEAHRHAPLVTALRYGKRSRRVPLTVRLSLAFTETGTLEVWCESTTTEHRWRLSFNLRGTESEGLEEPAAPDTGTSSDEVVIAPDALDAAGALIRQTFDPGATSVRPEALVGDLENILGHGKHAWPLAAIRTLADVLLGVESGRRKAPPFEVRWLNLTGFCMRPGFGTPLDGWRVSELRKVYAAGLAFPKEVQNQVEWLVLWQRVSAGFSAGQQRELAQRVIGQLGLGQRKAARLNPQIEREGWRLLGSLERLDAGQRVKLGDELLDRIRRDPGNTAFLWALGRFGARRPFYGPLNTVVPAAVAERWIDRLLNLKQVSNEAMSSIVQIGARTGDPARDIGEQARVSARDRLLERGASSDLVRPLDEAVAPAPPDAARAFGEPLPEGLRLE